MKNKQKVQLQNLRQKISYIDEEIFKLILKRLNLALNIGKIKRELKAPVEDKEQEQQVYLRNIKFAKNLSLDKLSTKNITKTLIKICKQGQKLGKKKYYKVNKTLP